MERFWSKVNKTDGCWVWTGATRSGYGAFRYKRKVVATHRLSWFLAYGWWPNEWLVCHHCDNRPCVRPEHLFIGSSLDNVNDAINKNRMVPPPIPPKIEARHGTLLMYQGRKCRCNECRAANALNEKLRRQHIKGMI